MKLVRVNGALLGDDLVDSRSLESIYRIEKGYHCGTSVFFVNLKDTEHHGLGISAAGLSHLERLF